MRIIKKNFPLLLFIFLLLLLIFFTYKDYGITWDENDYSIVGRFFLLGAKGLSPEDLQLVFFQIKGHPIIIDIIVTFFNSITRNFSFEMVHLIKALLSIPIFVFVYLVTARLFNKWYGLFSIILLVLFPRFYGDIFTNTADIPSALFFSLSLFYFLYYVKSNQNLFRQLIFALIIAFTINQRVIFCYLFVLDFIFLLFYKLNRKKWSPLMILFFSVIFIHLINPYLWEYPVVGLIDMIKISQNYPNLITVLFQGTYYPISNLPWDYLPKSMLITIPLITIFLFILGNIQLLLKIKKEAFKKDSFVYIYLLLLFYTPLLINFIFKPALYDSWRHFLFLTIPIVIIATYGLRLIIDLIKNPKFEALNFKEFRISNLMLIIVSFVVFLGLFLTFHEMVKLHPYEYIYYNSIIGGLPGANGKYETDYWGAGYREAVYWFNKNINNKNKKYVIFVEGNRFSAKYYFKNNMYLTNFPDVANYIFAVNRWGSASFYSGKIIYSVKREEVSLIVVKEVHKVN